MIFDQMYADTCPATQNWPNQIAVHEFTVQFAFEMTVYGVLRPTDEKRPTKIIVYVSHFLPNNHVSWHPDSRSTVWLW